MSVIAFLVRVEARRRWRTLLVLALLFGVVSGTAMAAAAGARRTASAYERLLRATNAEDVLVNPDDGYADFDAIEALPQVADACRALGAPAALAGPDGQPDFHTRYLPLQSDGRCLFDLSGPARVEGRLPDVSEPYETFLSRPVADQLDVSVGDRLPLLVFSEDEEAEPDTVELTVTGIGVYGQDALLDTDNQATFPILLLTPAFGERHPIDPELTFQGSLVQLRGGEADLASFNAAALDAAGESMHLEDRWSNERKASRSLEPYVLALWLFTFAVLVAGGGMLAGALHRTLSDPPTDQRTLSSLGVPLRQRAAVPLTLALLTGATGAALGVVLGIALSPLMPIGPAHGIEPDPGASVDRPVLALAAVLTILATLGVGVLVAASLDRAGASHQSDRLGLIARLRFGMPAPAAAGLRLATGELGASRSAARTTIVGAVLGVVAVLTVQVVGAGITRVVDTPARFGWTWDAYLIVAEEDYEDYEVTGGGPAYRGVVEQLDEIGVDRRTTIGMGQIDVEGETVATISMQVTEGDPVVPAMVSGRPPTTAEEIVLGATTLDRIGAALGDEVLVTSGTVRRSMRVVGQSTFPRMAEYPGAPNTGLGDGALVTTDALIDLTGALPYTGLLVATEDAAQLDALRARFPVGEPLDLEAAVVMVDRPQRPDALYGYDSTTTVRQILALLLAGLTVASVAIGLAAGARSARRELAVLRTLGFTRTQTRSVLHLHGALVAAAALLLGVPVGLAAGRIGWQAFAAHLGVATDPTTPLLVVATTALLVVTACLTLTVPPALAAVRRDPARVLRAE